MESAEYRLIKGYASLTALYYAFYYQKQAQNPKVMPVAMQCLIDLFDQSGGMTE